MTVKEHAVMVLGLFEFKCLYYYHYYYYLYLLL